MSGHLLDGGRPRAKWVCLGCRRAWKSAGVAAPRCAVCRAPLFWAGKEFAAPRQSDLRGWRKVEALLQSGVVFSERDRREPRPPKYLSEVPAFLNERREREHLAAHQSEQHRAGARALQKKRERQRQKRAAHKRRTDKVIERAARTSISASPATST